MEKSTSEQAKMKKLERQLRLYEILLPCKIAELSAIYRVFPYNMRLLQRDLADLRDAGLVSVKYSRKGKGYVKTEVPEFKKDATPKRKIYLKKLNRLGRLMSELTNEDLPLWQKKDNQEEGNFQEFFTAKDSYNEMFPGLSERTRQRDFEILRKLGHQIFYDSADHCFSYNEDDFCLKWIDAPDKIDDDFLDGTW